MELVLLADAPSAAGVVASWYFDEWCRDTGRCTQELVLAKVTAATQVDRAPLMVLARQAGEWVGLPSSRSAKWRCFRVRALVGWGLWVEKARGQGVASLLVTEIQQPCPQGGISKLYLQTENLTGGVYCRHGFKALEEVHYKGLHVLVMVADTSVPSSSEKVVQ